MLLDSGLFITIIEGQLVFGSNTQVEFLNLLLISALVQVSVCCVRLELRLCDLITIQMCRCVCILVVKLRWLHRILRILSGMVIIR